MAVYRITRFSSSNMDKAMELAESVRASMSEIKFDFIDVAQDDQGNGVVIARYPDAGAMEEATATAQQALGQLVVAGVIDGSSIEQWTGEVGISFCYFSAKGSISLPRTRPILAPDKPDDFFAKPTAIAEEVFRVAHQDRSAWSFRVELRPFGEIW